MRPLAVWMVAPVAMPTSLGLPWKLNVKRLPGGRQQSGSGTEADGASHSAHLASRAHAPDRGGRIGLVA